MATKIVSAILRIRRGSYESWNTNNPVLMEGETGVIISGVDKGKFKVGDGFSTWKELEYTIGADGEAATVAVGKVQTVENNIPAGVENVGTSLNAVLNFKIPKGEPGITIPDIKGLAHESEIGLDDTTYVYKVHENGLRQIAIEALLSHIYPPGTIYETTDMGFDPNVSFGGTWVPWGQGRVSVGVDPEDEELNEAEMMDGEKEHILTQDEMPSHTHIQDQHRHTVPYKAGSGTSTGNPAGSNSSATDSNVNSAYTTPTNQKTGGGLAHNNMMPYITVYKWKREE